MWFPLQEVWVVGKQKLRQTAIKVKELPYICFSEETSIHALLSDIKHSQIPVAQILFICSPSALSQQSSFCAGCTLLNGTDSLQEIPLFTPVYKAFNFMHYLTSCSLNLLPEIASFMSDKRWLWIRYSNINAFQSCHWGQSNFPQC